MTNSNSFKNNIVLSLIILIGSILRLMRLDFQSMWVDELFTMQITKPSIGYGEMYARLRSGDPHPPLYYFSSHFFTDIFGHTAFNARLFVAIIGILGLFAIYSLTKELTKSTKIACMATAILAVSPYHISYSQEARMYSMLFLFACVSTLFLIKFLRQNTWKYAVLYAISAALLCSTHFFGLFLLAGHALIFFYFLITSPKQKIKTFLFHCVIILILFILLYIPSIDILLKTSQTSSFWIERPSDHYVMETFRIFMGDSELITYLSIFCVAFYLFTFFRKPFHSYIIVANKDNEELQFLLLVTSVAITFIIPFTLSFVKIPMLVDRYLISILPFIIIMIALGINKIQNVVARYFLITSIIFLTIIQLFAIKKYYKTTTKTEFRGVSSYVLEQNTANHDFVSELTWYFSFYLDENKETRMIERNINSYLEELQNDTLHMKSFWYAGAHNTTLHIEDHLKDFLNQYFITSESIDLPGAWARHYVLKHEVKPFIIETVIIDRNISENPDINYNVEKIKNNNQILSLEGWIFFKDLFSKNTNINVILFNEETKSYVTISHTKVFRKDVGNSFRNNNYNYSGFYTEASLKDIPHGRYRIGFILQNKEKTGYVLTENFFEK